ncbi:MAG TPA: L,D-transpeptidase family protein [Actinomycetes bacterium]|nr:L,D-transpeptidase family protein [Actinomycetes bacterium]
MSSLLLSGCAALSASGTGGTAAPATEITASAPVAATATPTPTYTKTPKPTPPKPAPQAILERGDRGEQVRELQVRLSREDVFDHAVTGYFGSVTETSVRRFQQRHGLDVTGSVDTRTWSRLLALTGEVTSDDLYPQPKGPADSTLDARCLTGRVICVDKSTSSLRWVVDGEVEYWMEARFGATATPTDEGVFAINRKSRDHVSSIYESRMPFAQFFSGGQAVHFSPDFASVGYDGASHGCVNVRDWNLAERLFDDTRIGDRVVVYWS